MLPKRLPSRMPDLLHRLSSRLSRWLLERLARLECPIDQLDGVPIVVRLLFFSEDLHSGCSLANAFLEWTGGVKIDVVRDRMSNAQPDAFVE